MTQILIGGDHNQRRQLERWLDAWGLRSATLTAGAHPAAVPASEASCVIYACGPDAPPVPGEPAAPAAAAAPLVLVGASASSALDARAWTRIVDPGPEGATLAAALRPCLEIAGERDQASTGFCDFLNHELRTPLTAAGTALQTLALQLERAGGQSLELVDIALRNVRRLEQTVDWACDYLASTPESAPDDDDESACLTDLLQDLDELDVPVPLSWATGAGDWDAPVNLDRGQWRRLLRQVLRAVCYQVPGKSVHLELSTVDESSGQSGLLLVFQLTTDGAGDPVQRTGTEDEAEQLRRLLAFTVNPDLARRLHLRYDVVRLSESLRLRLLLPVELPVPV